MIVFHCLLCSLENLPTDVLQCPGCGGINFVAAYSTLSHPLHNRQLTEQTMNSSNEHTKPNIETKSERTDSLRSINGQNESSCKDFNFDYEDYTYGCTGSNVNTYNFSSENISLVHKQPSRNFNENPFEQKSLVAEIENASGFPYSSIEDKNDICNATRLNFFQDTLTVPSTQTPHVTTFYHRPTRTEYEKQFQMEMMFESPKETESMRIDNEDGKIGFAGSSQFFQENSMLQTYADDTIGKSKSKDTRDKRNNSSPSFLVKIGNSSTRTSLSQDLELVNEVSHSKAHSSKETRMDDQDNASPLLANRLSAHKSNGVLTCGICHRHFRNKLTFKLHVENNCDPKPYKCDRCDSKFDFECRLNDHRAVHSDEKPFKCDQCNYATKFKRHLNTHKRYHKNSI